MAIMSESVPLPAHLWHSVGAVFLHSDGSRVETPAEGHQPPAGDTSLHTAMSYSLSDDPSTCSFGIFAYYLDAVQACACTTADTTIPKTASLKLRVPPWSTAPAAEEFMVTLLHLTDMCQDMSAEVSIDGFVGILGYLHACVLPTVPQVRHETEHMMLHRSEIGVKGRVRHCPNFNVQQHKEIVLDA